MHLADMTGCNNMLMVKICKNFWKLLLVIAEFILFYFTCVDGFSQTEDNLAKLHSISQSVLDFKTSNGNE